MNTKLGWIAWGLLGLLVSNSALAAVCTSKNTGNWGSSSTWSCGHVPTQTDTVVLAAPYIVTLDNNYTTAGLTVNSGAVLDDNGNDLTVNGNVINNGTLGVAGGGGNLFMQAAGSAISGNGIFAGFILNIDAIGVSLQAGSTITLTNQAQVKVGSNNNATFNLNGTINGTALMPGDRALRVYQNSSMTINGAINAPNAYIRIEQGVTLINNGSVVVQYLDSNGPNASAIWTQGNNASLTLSITGNNSWKGTLLASASGNTVTYNSPATPFTPSGNTYYNLAGTGVVCPNTYTILGVSPCVAVPGLVTVMLNPGSCINTAGIGSVAWSPTPTTNVNLSDNIYATATVNGTTNFLKCTGYGFAIPATATILGIAVNVERKSSNTNRTTDGAMRLVKAGVIGTVDRATLSVYATTDIIEAHGNSADLWGGVWTPADINSSTFGAAFAAKTTRARTVSIDHMPISVSYTQPIIAAAPHHIQIDHDGIGQTCRSEILTVTACANATCTAPHFSTANVTGNVTWAGNPGGTLPFTINSGSTGQTTVLLPVTTAQTVTLSTSAISPAQTNPPSTCVNAGGGAACSLVFSTATGCFDAVEVGATATPLFTKLSGTAFSLDIVAATAYSGNLQVELVNGTTGTSCPSYTSLSPANSQNTTFSNQTRKTLNFNYANAARNVKVRITSNAGSSCSSDKFAIRPASLSITSSANSDPAGTNVNATPVIKAGAMFSLNATVPVTGYDGIPVVDNLKLLPHSGAVATGTLSGAFSAANPATGVAAGSNFSYNEVGYFKADIGGIYDDAFTAIDSAAGDCTNDFSNTLVGGKYGCKFGNLAPTAYFGRFIPDHFMIIAAAFDERSDLCNGGVLVLDSVTPCSSTFTYMGEQMDVNFMLSAANIGNTLTRNYTGTFAKLNPIATNNTLVWGAVDGTIPTNMTARLDTSIVASSGTGSFSNGSASIAASITITRGAADGPYLTLDVGIAPVDSDGVTTIFDLNTNNGMGVDRTKVNANSTKFRYGRSHITSAYGSDLLPLSLPITVEYWDGSNYIPSVEDNLSVVSLALGNYQGNLNAGNTLLSNPVIAAGRGQIGLSSFGNQGSVDVTVISPSYLPAANTGRGTFGIYGNRSNFVYRGRRGR